MELVGELVGSPDLHFTPCKFMFYSHVYGCRYKSGHLYPGLADRMIDGAGSAFSSLQEMEECNPEDHPHGLVEVLEEDGFSSARVWSADPRFFGWYNTYTVFDYYMFDHDLAEDESYCLS